MFLNNECGEDTIGTPTSRFNEVRDLGLEKFQCTLRKFVPTGEVTTGTQILNLAERWLEAYDIPRMGQGRIESSDRVWCEDILG